MNSQKKQIQNLQIDYIHEVSFYKYGIRLWVITSW